MQSHASRRMRGKAWRNLAVNWGRIAGRGISGEPTVRKHAHREGVPHESKLQARITPRRLYDQQFSGHLASDSAPVDDTDALLVDLGRLSAARRRAGAMGRCSWSRGLGHCRQYPTPRPFGPQYSFPWPLMDVILFLHREVDALGGPCVRSILTLLA